MKSDIDILRDKVEKIEKNERFRKKENLKEIRERKKSHLVNFKLEKGETRRNEKNH